MVGNPQEKQGGICIVRILPNATSDTRQLLLRLMPGKPDLALQDPAQDLPDGHRFPFQSLLVGLELKHFLKAAGFCSCSPIQRDLAIKQSLEGRLNGFSGCSSSATGISRLARLESVRDGRLAVSDLVAIGSGLG